MKPPPQVWRCRRCNWTYTPALPVKEAYCPHHAGAPRLMVLEERK